MRIVCLHGFLGLPSDWDFLGPALQQRGFDNQIVSLDLWSYVPASFKDLAREIAKQCRPDDLLLGYSMGGRLASQAFFFEKACSEGGLVVVSAHYGGLNSQEAAGRVTSDDQWATRFENGDWDSLLKDWSAQSVFANDGPTNLVRGADNFDRSDLAHGLRTWTVAHQPDARSAMDDCERPVLWMAGQHDTKYAGIAESIDGRFANLHTRVVKGAGHRLPWSAENSFLEELCSFLRTFLSTDKSSK